MPPSKPARLGYVDPDAPPGSMSNPYPWYHPHPSPANGPAATSGKHPRPSPPKVQQRPSHLPVPPTTIVQAPVRPPAPAPSSPPPRHQPSDSRRASPPFMSGALQRDTPRPRSAHPPRRVSFAPSPCARPARSNEDGDIRYGRDWRYVVPSSYEPPPGGGGGGGGAQHRAADVDHGRSKPRDYPAGGGCLSTVPNGQRGRERAGSGPRVAGRGRSGSRDRGSAAAVRVWCHVCGERPVRVEDGGVAFCGRCYEEAQEAWAQLEG